MVQDASTKEYEVETGKMGDLIVFAKSMGKSCSVLSNQVSSLNILLVRETVAKKDFETILSFLQFVSNYANFHNTPLQCFNSLCTNRKVLLFVLLEGWGNEKDNDKKAM